MSEPIRIQLDALQSEELRQAGDCFICAGKVSYPGDPSRYVLHLLPAGVGAVSDCCRIVRGEAKAIKVSAKQ